MMARIDPDGIFSRREKLILLLASAGPLGHLPKAPGTFGTLPGFVIFLGAAAIGSLWGFALITIALFFLSVRICGRAASLTNEKDPSWVVMDEYSAMVAALSPWPLILYLKSGAWPTIHQLVSDPAVFWIAPVAFVAFRFFDIFKPFPINVSQNLPGGWGITVDDWLAAAATALCLSVAIHFFHPSLTGSL